MNLTYQANKLELIEYSDVEFTRYKDDNKFTPCYIFTFDDSTIAWPYKKHVYIAQHTQKEEFIVCNVTTKFIILTNKCLKNLRPNLDQEPI